MPKTAESFRLSDPAREKLTALAEVYGNKTTVVELAIDRMHREEMIMKRNSTNSYAYDMYVDRSADPREIAMWTQDQIEEAIADAVREAALDSEPDASDAEINTAIEETAALILLEAQYLAAQYAERDSD